MSAGRSGAVRRAAADQAAARMRSPALPAPPAPQGQALPAPCTDADYEGSRKAAQRYGYSPQSKSGMVELHHQRLLTRDEFKEALHRTPGGVAGPTGREVVVADSGFRVV